MAEETQAEIERLRRRLRREQLAKQQAEELLEQKSEELYDALESLRQESRVSQELIEALQVASDGIAVTDPEGVFTFMNTAHAALFGYEAEELLGRSWSVLYEPHWAKEIASTAMPVVFSEGSWRGEATGLRKDGSFLEQEIVLTARPNGTGLICVTRDASERRRRQARMHELEHELRQSERTTALMTLRSAVAHDLGNLIGIIDGYATLLESQLADRPARDQARKILTAGHAAGQILSELGQEAETAFVEIDLVTSLRKLAELVEAIKPPAVILTTDFPSEAVVRVREALLSRCVLNLAKNAFEVMPGGGALTMRLMRNASCSLDGGRPVKRLGPPVPDPEWILEMRDTGPGFPEGQLDKLLEPFVTTKTGQALSGLGLSSVALLAESGSASVEIDSREGEGALFRILFPKQTPAGVRVLPKRAGTGEGRRVVLVEDQAEVGEVVASLLRDDGLEATLLTDAQLARDVLLGGGEADVVITDLDMPELNGEALAATVSACRPELPFVLLTALPEKVQDLELFSSVLRKPVERSDLVDAVHRAFAGRPAFREG